MQTLRFVSIAALATVASCKFPSGQTEPALPPPDTLTPPAELAGATKVTVDHGLATPICKLRLVPEGGPDRDVNWLAKPLARDKQARGLVKPGTYTIIIEPCDHEPVLRRTAKIDRMWTIRTAYDRFVRTFGEDGTHSDGHETWGWTTFYTPTPPSEMPRAYSAGPSAPAQPSGAGEESQPEPQRDCVPSGAPLPRGKQCCYGTFTTGPGGQETCT